jgi:hypothetical protein
MFAMDDGEDGDGNLTTVLLDDSLSSSLSFELVSLTRPFVTSLVAGFMSGNTWYGTTDPSLSSSEL